MSVRVISFGRPPEIPTLFVIEKVDGPSFRVTRMAGRQPRAIVSEDDTLDEAWEVAMRLAEALCVVGCRMVSIFDLTVEGAT
jgi:hypothetical protein